MDFDWNCERVEEQIKNKLGESNTELLEILDTQDNNARLLIKNK